MQGSFGVQMKGQTFKTWIEVMKKDLPGLKITKGFWKYRVARRVKIHVVDRNNFRMIYDDDAIKKYALQPFYLMIRQTDDVGIISIVPVQSMLFSQGFRCEELGFL